MGRCLNWYVSINLIWEIEVSSTLPLYLVLARTTATFFHYIYVRARSRVKHAISIDSAWVVILPVTQGDYHVTSFHQYNPFSWLTPVQNQDTWFWVTIKSQLPNLAWLLYNAGQAQAQRLISIVCHWKRVLDSQVVHPDPSFSTLSGVWSFSWSSASLKYSCRKEWERYEMIASPLSGSFL